MTRIAVIGGGRIGEALLAGLLESGRLVKDLVVAENQPARARLLDERFGVRVTATVADAAAGADVLVLAVKPADIDRVLRDLAAADLASNAEQIVVSVAAGVRTAHVEAALPAGFPVVRVMPNTPMLVGEGMCAVAAGRHASAQQVDEVTELLQAVGKVVVVAEKQMDAVTAVSGSGPAYFFLMAEALIEAGVGVGLPHEVATQLVVQTMVGSAAMLDSSGQDAVALRTAVTSPGGTTAAAVRELERSGVRSALLEAVHAAHDCSAQQPNPTRPA